MARCDCLRILSEVAGALESLEKTGLEQILYLTEPPLTEADKDFVLETLGRGSITIFSNDPNVSAWQETRVPFVWLGEYRDGIERVALKTIEIAPYPRMAGWEKESVSEALTRIKEIQALAANPK